jgi:DNA-binding transcriptional LysR family regulator
MLNPQWLNTFVTLIDTGHFTKTAEKLFMTQPGVSQHINKLEAACGYMLIRRAKKSFDLTEQGRLVYQYAKKLMNDEQQLLEKLAFDEPYAGQCNLACSGALALMLYPKFLEIQKQHPQLVIQLKAAPNQQILEEVRTGTVDLGIVTDVPKNHGFDIQKIGQEQLCLVLPNNTTISPQKENFLETLGLINHPDAEHYLSLYFAQSQELSWSSVSIEHIPVSGYINQISQILEPVAKGLGFTVLPKSAVDSFKDAHRIKIFKAQEPVIETLYRVKKQHRVLPARFTSIEVTIIDYFESIRLS